MATATETEPQSIAAALEEASDIVDQVSNYSTLITDSLYVIVGGMIAVFLLYKLTSKFLFPYVKNKRLLRVIFGTVYVLILVVTTLLILEQLGINTISISKIAFTVVLLGAVIIFFLVPFFPRLPFMIGQMIEVGGILGIVDNISTLHTTIRTFDGSIVFIPNPMILASKIVNFADLPERRITMNMKVNLDADMEEVRNRIISIMANDQRVLTEPESPLARVTAADANGISLTALCWTKNNDFLNTQSDLWIQVVNAFKNDADIHMVLPQQEIQIVNT